mgnify:CR=1 FL=1
MTPKKKVDHGEQFIEDSDSAEELKEDSDDSGSNEDEDSDGNEAEKEAEQEAEKEAAKIEEMKQFAEDNGIELTFEKKEEPKDKEVIPWKMTPELLAKLQIEDDKRFMEKMKKYIPPPLEILKK